MHCGRPLLMPAHSAASRHTVTSVLGLHSIIHTLLIFAEVRRLSSPHNYLVDYLCELLTSHDAGGRSLSIFSAAYVSYSFFVPPRVGG